MTRNMRTNLIYMAVEAIRSYAGPNASREQAARVLPEWQWLVPLGGEEEGLAAEILWHFQPAEPPMVAQRDFLPVEHGVAIAKLTPDGNGYFIECHCRRMFEGGGRGGAAAAERFFRRHLAEVDAVVAA